MQYLAEAKLIQNRYNQHAAHDPTAILDKEENFVDLVPQAIELQELKQTSSDVN